MVASAGATNAGTVDDLAGIADVCADRGVWFHVDGAYGGAGLVAPSVRPLYDGIERADSFIVDPHKWLFAPYDALRPALPRSRGRARDAHRQEASLPGHVPRRRRDWNPADYAYHLTRRARGLPLWFSLATYGTAAYRDAVETVLRSPATPPSEIRRHPSWSC